MTFPCMISAIPLHDACDLCMTCGRLPCHRHYPPTQVLAPRSSGPQLAYQPFIGILDIFMARALAETPLVSRRACTERDAHVFS